MKKILAIILSLALALTSAVAMMITAFADNDPIILDLTVENPEVGGKNGKLGKTWGGDNVGTSSYDADEQAWKLENTVAIDGWSGGFEEFKFEPVIGAVDFETYTYCVITYKTNNLVAESGERYVGINGKGAATIVEGGIAPSEGEYTSAVVSTEDFGTTDRIIIVMNTHSGGTLEPGAQIFVKYIAFFASEEEANAFVESLNETEAEPIILDLTVENPEVGGKNGKLGKTWGGDNVGTSAYDSDAQAWKLENTVAIGGWSGGFEEFKYGPVIGEVDYDTYAYCVITYKTNNMTAESGERKIEIKGQGASTILEDPLDPSEGEYTSAVISTEDFGTTDRIVIVMNAWSGGELAPGAQTFVKYIAFFASEEAANEFVESLDLTEPESSEPETSEPETSEPEGSEDSGEESGKEGADTGDVAMISGAILLCAAAGVVAVISKKSKR